MFAMLRRMMMRVFRHVFGVAGGEMMEFGVLRLLRQRPAHHAGQERADYHAEHAGK